MRNPFSFWTEMDEDRKDRIIRMTGLVMAAFTVFTLLSSVSYLFTWKADQSLLGDPKMMNLDAPVHNACGKLGLKWANLLVCRWFGLGSMALVLVLAILSVRMLFGKRSFSVIKAVILALTAAALSSFLLAFFGGIAGAQTAYGGGWGGQFGAHAVASIKNLIGTVPTFLVLAILVAAWFVGASTRFSRWFTRWGRHGSGTEEEAPASREEKPLQKKFRWVEHPAKEAAPEAPQEDPYAEPAEAAPVGPIPPFQWPSHASQMSVSEDTAVAGGAVVEEPAVRPSSQPQPQPEPVAADVRAPESDSLEIIEGEELSTDVQEELTRIDVREELENYRFPPLELLEDYESSRQEVSQDELKRNNYKIRATLKTYKIDVDNVKAIVGPTVTLYKVYPAPGVRISQIKRLQDDIAMSLQAKGVRVVTLADSVGIEVANDRPSIVPLKAMLNDESFRETKAELPIAIGYTITQKVKVFDLTDAPHLLVAGATKQGKSVGLNVLITSLLYAKHPSELKFVFVDPKKVEFTAYARLLKHYLAVLPTAGSEADEINNAIAKDSKPAEQILKSLCIEMDARYDLLSKAMVNNVKSYNEKYKDRHLLPTEGHKYLPYIVVVIDEYADLTMSTGASGDVKTIARSISSSIIRLAQKGRAAGIHVVIATQRPSVDVITGLIKANFPTRIAFRVLSMTDSRTILDAPGADKLIGKGDMLYYAGVDMERVQCAFISSEEIGAVTEFIGNQTGYKKSYNTPYYLPAPEPDQVEDGGGMIDMKNLDERFVEAAKLVVMNQRGSTSDLQRRLGMGYAKAGRVMDQLEAAGIVGPQEGSKPRQVLVNDLTELDGILNAFMNQ